MAGCRLGYVVGNPEDIKYVQKFCTPHNTNAFAMLFAEKIITTPGMVDALIAKFNEGRNYLLSSRAPLIPIFRRGKWEKKLAISYLLSQRLMRDILLNG